MTNYAQLARAKRLIALRSMTPRSAGGHDRPKAEFRSRRAPQVIALDAGAPYRSLDSITTFYHC